MFQRFHKVREERESGFTLIELLVVILIIAILAAIAIPVFLRQREKGWRSQVESALKNAATAQESFLTTNSTYADTLSELEAEGFKKAARVELTDANIVISTGVGYCMKANHLDLPDTVDYWYHSADGRPVTTIPTATSPACPAA